ncbi:NADH-quinone oxidoreductase subunit L [Kozakia baliensis]|uniref:NADH-quinone oxidoreductase subunit L n=1 Tax=Kozakia baliensis TaxID=153496 RepID=UPI000494ED85|nr:NADH-quinone oxidoreductase subunit L [Kozakia baliensis]
MDAVLLPFVVLSPFLGALILLFAAGRMPPRATGIVGVGSIGISALLALVIAGSFMSNPPPADTLQVGLWRWIDVEGFQSTIALTLDPLSLLMMLVVTVVGFLIHLYAYGYMRSDRDINRFFAYMNLFVAAMLVLVFSSDLLSLYIGWEGVGVCSFLLIGFWYEEEANCVAARKAFIITRIGDAFMLCGLLLLATSTGTLSIEALTHQAGATMPAITRTIALFLLLGGAVAKSAQVPMQTWLPDAMAGPTPVSALIHAATMVTAGVYIVARLHSLFAEAPVVMTVTSFIGMVTLLLAAGSALVQTDIKRILAYSTMSQLGYMFLALGTGAWEAAVFHLFTHAFFKALLFMGAGAIILRVHHKQNIYEMGGLRKAMPGVFYAFLAGSAALAGMPLLTAGFYSKEMILQNAWHANPILWVGALIGAFMTGLYIFRCVFLVFFGPMHTVPSGRTAPVMGVPLACLSVLALGGGLVEAPDVILPVHFLSHFVAPVFGEPKGEGPILLLLIGSAVPLAGITAAWLIWGPQAQMRARAEQLGAERGPEEDVAHLARVGWGFDFFYNYLIVRPFMALGYRNKSDFLDHMSNGLAAVTRSGGGFFGRMQSGQVRRYAGWIAAGTVAALCLAVLS